MVNAFWLYPIAVLAAIVGYAFHALMCCAKDPDPMHDESHAKTRYECAECKPTDGVYNCAECRKQGGNT